MRHLLTMLMAVYATAASAALEVGKTYRIALAADNSKSLMVENAALDNQAPVVLWTETDVPAQQWTVRSLTETGRATLMNVYTGRYLSVNNGRVIQAASAASWTLKELDAQANIYAMTYLTKQLNANSVQDGTPLGTTGAPTNLGGQWNGAAWQFVEVTAQPVFTTEMRDRMGEGFLNHYLQNKGMNMRTFVNGGWGECETMEAVLDMYEQTSDRKYWNTWAYCYKYFKQKVGNIWTGGTLTGGYDWYGYDFNDDVMWQIIGTARAANMSGSKEYLDDARRNFDAIYERANLGYVKLLRWAEHTGDRNGTNSCINGPAEVAACYIGIAAADESYFEKARELYENQRRYLFDANTGHVYDAVVLNPQTGQVVSSNQWASTYNQGTMLGAATLLYLHYADERYRQDADRIIRYAMQNLCNEHGIVKVCQNADGDFQGFKGILMRYAGLYARTFDNKEVKAWLVKNAFHAYNNQNSRHYGHSAWLTKAAEDDRFGNVDYSHQAFGASTALSAAFAVPLSTAETDAVVAPTAVSRHGKQDNATYDLSGKHIANTAMANRRTGRKSIYVQRGRKYVK